MTGPRDWGLSAWLLVALALAVGLTVAVGASTGAEAYGTFNPAWDGGSELRAAVADAGAEPYVLLAAGDYDALDPADTAVVVLSPADAYDTADRARLAAYVDGGGTLVVAEDFRPHANPLLRAVGARARVTGEPLRDNLRNTRTAAFPLATNVSRVASSDAGAERPGAAGDGDDAGSGGTDPADAGLTRGVDALALNHPSTVAPNGARVLVNSSRFAYLDTNRNERPDAGERVGRYPVVTAESVGAGRVVVVSDPSLFINAMATAADNRRFVRNVATGHGRVGIDQTHAGGQPPLAVALVSVRRDPLLQLLVGGAGLAVVALANRQLDTPTHGDGGKRDAARDDTEADVREPTRGAATQRVQTALLRSLTVDDEGADERDDE
jgi:hypothetical protein